MPDRPALYGAIDLGGTKLRSLVVDAGGRVYGADIRPSFAQEGLQPVVRRMVESLDASLAAAGAIRSELKAVGIASPGAVDVVRGIVPNAPQLPGWQDVPLREIMARELGVETYLENDATAAALGEHVYGAGRGSRYMLFITVSTGIGGGIVIDGQLYRGKSGAAGELGHVILDPDGPPCGCGAHGHLESFSSGTAIARRGEELVRAGESPVLAKLREVEGPVTAEMMERAADAGDTASREVFREAGHYLGIALASYVNIFNPEVILIGGGVARAADLFMDQAEATMRSLAMTQPLRDVRLALGQLGDRAGALGVLAAMVDRARSGKRPVRRK